MIMAADIPLAAPAQAGILDGFWNSQPDPSIMEPPDVSWKDLFPAQRNRAYKLDRPLTSEELNSTYNNFYEFGSSKTIAEAAKELQPDPWQVKISGLVEEEKTVDFDQLIRAMSLEERLYRHRCVEAWSMAIPWTGFPLKALVDYARPLGTARYMVMETFFDPKIAPGQRQSWYPWPYREGVTMEEAVNPLAFIATGTYGHQILKQHGAPLRLVLPWKYGFKSIKSITNLIFTEKTTCEFLATVTIWRIWILGQC